MIQECTCSDQEPQKKFDLAKIKCKNFRQYLKDLTNIREKSKQSNQVNEVETTKPKNSETGGISESKSKVRYLKDETTIQRLFKINLKLNHRRIPSITKDQSLVQSDQISNLSSFRNLSNDQKNIVEDSKQRTNSLLMIRRNRAQFLCKQTD